MKNFIFIFICITGIVKCFDKFFLSKTYTGQSCAATLVCGDGYCCKYSAACICSVEPCRELCMHGDIIGANLQANPPAEAEKKDDSKKEEGGDEEKKDEGEGGKRKKRKKKRTKKNFMIQNDENESEDKPKKTAHYRRHKSIGQKLLTILEDIRDKRFRHHPPKDHMQNKEEVVEIKEKPKKAIFFQQEKSTKKENKASKSASILSRVKMHV